MKKVSYRLGPIFLYIRLGAVFIAPRPPVDQFPLSAHLTIMSLDKGMAWFGFVLGASGMMATNALAKLPTFRRASHVIQFDIYLEMLVD